MKFPSQLTRRDPKAHKNLFGHVLVLAGSRRMIGAGALTSLAAMRSGAGLVTWGVPASLNSPAQKKAAHVVMTLPLKETQNQTLAVGAFVEIQKFFAKCSAIALGPGLSTHPGTQKLILKIIAESPRPLVIDADALNTLAGRDSRILTKTRTPKILTPHPGEMARLTGLRKSNIEKNREEIARKFAKKYQCVLVLKGHRTIVASPDGKTYLNKTGNPGMATAGSGDVLTGMIAAFLAQGLSAFEAAKWGVYLHGKASDLAAKAKGKISLIASDIVDFIPKVFKKNG